MGKAAIYTPYLDTLGGGERYMLSAAKAISDAGYTTYIQAESAQLKMAEERFGLDLSSIKAIDDIQRGDGYDICLWLSDGSIPALKARKNILHFQRPFYKVQGKSLLNRAKFFRINSVIVNSGFTKTWIDQEYPVESVVVYPPVDTDKFKPQKKDNLILYVGRFSKLEQSKGQDILVKAFKEFHATGDHKTFKFVLAGGSEVGKGEFVNELISSAKGYEIEIVENVEFNKLKKLFSKSKFFWSAAGYGIDEKRNPEKMEHFGITVVEAMSAGCIPLVFNGGGHKEIVRHGVNGCLWDTTEQLVRFTNGLIDNSKEAKIISDQAISDSQNYSYEHFQKNLLKLL